MLNRIIYFSIQNKLIIGLFTLALIAWGGYSLSRLPIDAVPDITNNQVQIITTSPSIAAQEVERLVTFPVETEMATIPDMLEIRSISRFGLSVVTIVFKDNVDVYWARQQVSERLKAASTQIPPGIGTPELAPVTTGLGEIYQYVLHTKKGFEQRYSPTELRTVQDWIVRRQLLGTGGVADVSSFGGYLKQYEIAIDPLKLRSFGISMSALFTALEQNNQNTGGAYIDKKPNAYFIRSEGLVGSLEDIRKIAVRQTADGLPVRISDLAEVRFGHAVRYGAMTRNNDGEVVGGLVLMLKGANSSEVIGNVKEKIAQIRKSLPEGVVIEPFLDRAKLVDKAISTVSRNLIEGALIVIFVLVLMLGNIRAGLVVASVIPLSMLFAVSMMHLFGVSGNLMSLGAIDFGLIVDGAVIVVEATLHHIAGKNYRQPLTRAEMDHEVFESASRIRNSAAFGEIIILIVYLPILALVGIEGKMFRPMAQTVSFAILGAFVLSLTYIPMMSALFLSRENVHKAGISDRMITFFQKIYHPALELALRRKTLVLVTAIVLFAASLIIFRSMGSEFIPQLDEGDFAVETRVLTGSSISETIDAIQKASSLLLRDYPDEVQEVVGKIGSAEIPTDPMPVEAADLMIILKNKNQWTSAASREELAGKMQQSLTSTIPGVTFGFQQPIQMRFNELMTGVKQDVAIKIFGDDLDVLADQGRKVGALVAGVNGVADLYVESVGGLPQVMVRFDRDRLAQFGVSIADANRALSTAFAGSSAGLVYEGEKRFDLVARLDQKDRQGLADVSALFVTGAGGKQIPMNQIADISIRTGTNQIQREDARRRITVAFNARGRDVESIMQDVQARIHRRISLPEGYFITYGGQFENLREANARLSVAVPVALLLIFVLLYFTFHSFRQSIVILTAIPLSAIGGVLALWMRGMPFSISAGIGFIALFGVAVLNGIVLIAEFNALRNQGITDLKSIIMTGTATRLRPVLMTALVASLGFLPMAISASAGAEVQRPLATVVIGGLISATMLTLFVLPVIYMLTEKRFLRKPGTTVALILLVLCCAPAARAQKRISIQEAISLATANNLRLREGRAQEAYQEALRGTAADVAKTELSILGGQYNSRKFDNNLTLTQVLPNVATVRRRKALLESEWQESRISSAATRAEIIRDVRQTYDGLLFLQNQRKLLQQELDRAKAFVNAASLRVRTGESGELEASTALSVQGEMEARLIRNASQTDDLQWNLQILLNSREIYLPDKDSLTRLSLITLTDSSALAQNPLLQFRAQRIQTNQHFTRLQKSLLLPDWNLGYFNQSLIGFQNTAGSEVYYGASRRFQGGQLGVALPVFNKAAKARIQAAKAAENVAAIAMSQAQLELSARLGQQMQAYQKASQSLSIFENQTITLARKIREKATIAYRAGDISYVEFSQSQSRALSIEATYLELVQSLNRTVIEIEYLLNKTE